MIPADSKGPSVTAPGARAALALLLLINLMNYVDRQILSAVEEPIGREFNVSAVATGWLATTFLLAYMVFSPIFGVLADRVSRWVIVGGGVIVWSLASGGSGVAGAVGVFWLLIVMRLVIGIGEAAYGPVAPTIIADLFPVEKRGKVLAWFYAAIPVGSALGYVIGGQFHDHWQWAFYLTVPPGLVLGVWCFFMRDPRRIAPVAVSAPVTDPTMPVVRKARLDEYLSLLHTKSFLLVTAGMTASTFALGGIAFFMPRYLAGQGLDPKSSNTTFGAIVVVSGLLSTISGGVLADKLRQRFSGSYFLVSGIGLILGFPFFLLTLWLPFPSAWVPLFVAVFCLFFSTGPTNAIIANVTPSAVRATAFAANIFVIHAFGDAISPVLIGWVASRRSLTTGFLVVALMMLVGGVFWILGAPHLQADTRRADTGGASNDE